MSKITLTSIGSLVDSTTAQTNINANNAIIQTAFDNTLSRDGTSPNTMGNTLDMNNNQIINLPAPNNNNSPLRLTDLPAGAVNPSLVAGTNIVIGGVTISTTSTPTFTTVNSATIPTVVDTLVGRTTTDELTNKTLTSSIGKGTWTASGTWTLPAYTLNGTVSGGGNNLNNVVIGSTTPLAGTFTTLKSTTLGVGNNASIYTASVSSNTTQGVVGVSATTGTVLQIAGKDTFPSTVEINGFGNQTLIAGTRADGTAASKAAIAAANEPLYANFAYGWNGSIYNTCGGFIIWSAEAFSGVKNGSYLSLFTTPVGSTSIVETVRLQASGGVSIGDFATDLGANNLRVGGIISTSIPVTSTSVTRTISATEGSSIFNAAGTCTATLPSATTNTGRWWYAKTQTAQLVNSATSNIVPLNGGAAGTAILAATIGKWAILQSDSSNWVIMAAN